MAIAELPVTPADALRHRLERAGVPPRYLGCRFSTFVVRRGTERALEASRAVALNEREGLVLCGPAGTGKTHLVVSIVAERIEQWIASGGSEPIEWTDPAGQAFVSRRPELRVRLVSVPGFLDQLRGRIRFADAEDPLPGLVEADLLVLDDLGREKVTDWASERLYVLVNERYNALRPTVVTSNYMPAELADRGYDAVVSRLVEGASAVSISAPDYRSARPARP